MAIRPSPSVDTPERDFTTIVPEVAIQPGALAGVFHWGPVNERTLVDSEESLKKRFGGPDNFNPETWFSAASFLSYSRSLWIARAANTIGSSPIVSTVVEAANATVLADSANLVVGMTVASSSNAGIKIGTSIATIVNSTAITITPASAALATTASDVQFITNTAFSAIANSGEVAGLSSQIIKNEDDFTGKDPSTFDSDVHFIARYPGADGNSLRISTCANSTGYSETVQLDDFGANTTFALNVNSNTGTFVITTTSNTEAEANAVTFLTHFNVTDKLQLGNTQIGFQYLKITDIGAAIIAGNSTFGTATVEFDFDDQYKLSSNIALDSANAVGANTVTRYWEFFQSVDKAPALSDYQIGFGNNAVNSDEMHVVIVDDGGKFTGVPGTVLEIFERVSRATDAKNIDGGTNYWKDVINERSEYVWAINDLSGAASNTALNLVSSTLDIQNYDFVMGNDGKDEANIDFGSLAYAWDRFQSAEDVSVRYLITGKNTGTTLANYLIDNIAEKRRDCVVFISPQKGNVVNNLNNEQASVITFRNSLRATSYGFLDSGYKYMPDRYNNINRWVPLNGDIAGLAARTAETNDEWWSFAGYNRGQIKNIIKLAYNPKEAQRDILYPADVNPVVTFDGLGTVLFGDKTLLGKPSAFSRINVRMLFIVLRTAIAEMAKFSLFEFNNDFTQSAFRNAVNPYLRDVQGRQGITDFLVVCDSTNNTPQVVQTNRFVGDIFVKPSISINWITLNFNAVGQQVEFSEVVGRPPGSRV